MRFIENDGPMMDHHSLTIHLDWLFPLKSIPIIVSTIRREGKRKQDKSPRREIGDGAMKVDGWTGVVLGAMEVKGWEADHGRAVVK